MKAASLIGASAPGKLFLSGEYAVLEGAPAIACAVGRHVRVRVLDAGANEREEAALWREAAEDLIIAQGLGETRPGRGLEIDSRPLHAADGTKYGLGSSAAVAASVAGALLALQGPLPETPAQLRLAGALHRSRQGPGGSGADVAASLYGGVVAVSGGRVERIAWPAGLVCAVLWSGFCANTGRALARFRESLQGGSPRVQDGLRRLAMEAEAVNQAWRLGAGDALEALAQYSRVWRELDRAARLGIYSPPHRKLLDLAHSAGCVYKPSGAGGGDCGLALCSDPQALARMRRMAAGEGYETLEMELAVKGMNVTRRQQSASAAGGWGE